MKTAINSHFVAYYWMTSSNESFHSKVKGNFGGV
jgi:hypothetical protein